MSEFLYELLGATLLFLTGFWRGRVSMKSEVETLVNSALAAKREQS